MIEASGKTLVETTRNLLYEIFENVKTVTSERKESFKIKVGCISMEVCIKRLLRRVIEECKRKKLKPVELEMEVIPNRGKWYVVATISALECSEVQLSANRIKEVKLEEKEDGWRCIVL